jgi:hypothetical protein
MLLAGAGASAADGGTVSARGALGGAGLGATSGAAAGGSSAGSVGVATCRGGGALGCSMNQAPPRTARLTPAANSFVLRVDTRLS